MKTFLYTRTSIRNSEEDGIADGLVGRWYYHDQLLMVIEAENAESAALYLGIRILDSFDRSNVGCPTIYYTSNYYEGAVERPMNHPPGYFFLSLKELERSDEGNHPNWADAWRLRVTAPNHANAN